VSWQILPLLDPHQGEVCVQSCKVIAAQERFPSGVAQTPLDFKFHLTALSSVSHNFLHIPFGIVWGAEVVWVRIMPVRKQGIIIHMVGP
jgi:hypothetical protein